MFAKNIRTSNFFSNHTFIRSSVLLAVLVVMGMYSDLYAQKGGRGRGRSQGRGGNVLRGNKLLQDGRGGSTRSSKGNKSSKGFSSDKFKKSESGARQPSRPQSGFERNLQNRSALQNSNSNFDPRIKNELRKLEHRQQVAEHLRRIGDKNGNPRLYEVADQLDEKSLSHYEKQIGKADAKELAKREAKTIENASKSFEDQNERTTPNPGDPRHPMTQRIDAAEKSLARRMELADKLEQLGVKQSNPRMTEASQQLREMALENFTNNLSGITEFDSAPSNN